MGVPTTLTHTGVLAGVPAAGAEPLSLQEIMNTSFAATFATKKGAQPTINNPSVGSPFVIPLEGVVKVRMILLRSRVSMRVRITWALGTDQDIPVSGLLLLFVPNVGDEITAIKIVGVGPVEYVLAGDES